jgi:hypothetical protein
VAFEQEPGGVEPGVERHAWASEYAAILPLVQDEPEQALPDLASLVGRMLADRGHPAELGGALDQSEQALTFAAAAELADRARTGEDLDPGDVGFAIEQLQAVYESLIEDTPTA